MLGIETLKNRISFRALLDGSGRFEDKAHFVLTEGRAYLTVAPTQPPRGTPNECFSNSQLLALDAHLTYVEGFAFFHEGEWPYDHAWCIDTEGRVYDPTWSPPSTAYLGLPFATAYVRRRLGKQGRPRKRSGETYKTCGSLLDDYDFAVITGRAKGWRA